MQEYTQMSQVALEALQSELQAKYDAYRQKNLKLDMSRGKPGPDQLDLSMELLRCTDYKAADGTDCRNYGVLDGIPECKALFAEILGVAPENIIIGGNASLTLMYDYIAQAMTHGTGGAPWAAQSKVKILCPSPGYDRHFSICEYFGLEMIPVTMTAEGPDLEQVEALVRDESVKGMFCVPKYSNPQGITYSDRVVRGLAAMQTAPDFRIIWDNAYVVHDLYGTSDPLLNLLDECAKCGHEDRAVMFASTSKITFPGGGISAIAASENNVASIKKRLFFQTIGPDKLNQLRHVKLFGNLQGIRAHMQRHAAVLRPKFTMVLDIMDRELKSAGVASWHKPSGGYFISLDVLSGCAGRVVALCKEAGVIFTPAGATYPYGKDPQDQNIRIAPTFPPVSELGIAVELLCICVKLACVEKLLQS